MVDRASTGEQRRSTSIRAYAWLVALVGALLFIGSGVAYLLNHAWAFKAEIGAGLGFVLLLVAVLLRPDIVRVALTGRSVRYGSNAAILSLAVIGILALLNFLAVKYHWEYDVTENQEFTLSEQTLQLVQNLDEPVQVIGFFQAGDGRLSLARKYLDRYSRHTDMLTYEFHDPNVEPALAKSFELSNYGLVFVSAQNRYETPTVDEQTITSALLRVTSKRSKIVYFITGQTPYSLANTSPEGYSMVKHALERENYQVNELNLATATAVPQDADILILAGADRELPEVETRLISDWLEHGGKLMVLADPLQPKPLEPVLHRYGLAWHDGFVVDVSDSLVTLGPEGLTRQVTAPMLVRYPYHEMTRGLNGFRTFFPFSRAINLVSTNMLTASVAPVLSTSPNSWIETDSQSTDLQYDEGRDLPGPVHIGVAAENLTSDVRLVVIGNASFISNQNLSPEVANQDLFLNAVNWLAEDEDLISIRPKPPTNRQLFLTPMQYSITVLTTLVVIPLVVMSTGVVVWWKRR